MPELYGQPYKYELRRTIAEQHKQIFDLYSERRRLKAQLGLAQAKVAELENKLQHVAQLSKEILGETDRDIKDAVVERYLQKQKEQFEET